LQSAQELIQTLQHSFGFRWEPLRSLQIGTHFVVYWPVRLRQPTPIHAVQCFSAAALQRRGATINLYLDDLGGKECSVEFFMDRVRLWTQHVGGDFEAIQVRLFSEVITSEVADSIWDNIHIWLGSTEYRLEKVLQIAKLLPREIGTLNWSDVVKQRPRRLLNPPLVWTCLGLAKADSNGQPVLTLGGYDERFLWEAWRELTNSLEGSAGHLYGAELAEPGTDRAQALHMARTEMAWSSRDDILRALERDQQPNNAEPFPRARLMSWLLLGCIALPRYLAGSDPLFIPTQRGAIPIGDLEHLPAPERSEALATAAATWLF
jgi:hypothetical protein